MYKIKHVKLLISLIMLLQLGVLYSQTVAEIKYYGTKDVVNKTKHFLDNYQMHLLILEDFINVEFLNDSTLQVIPNDIQIQYLQNQKFLIVRFSKPRSCFFSLFPNIFNPKTNLSDIRIYKISYKGMLIKTGEIGISFYFRERGYAVSQTFIMIPCSEYKNDFGKYFSNE